MIQNNSVNTDNPPPFTARLLNSHMVLGLLFFITAARLAFIAISPLGPGVDEAQYWLWGQDLQFGYYSKPPLIAWLLGMVDAMFGQSAFTLRASGPILHLITSLILWQTGRLIAGEGCGRIAALLWLSLPAVGLGSFVMSTDSLMLPFWAGALYFIFCGQKRPAIYLRYMAAAGLCVGVASLAKYAGLYFLLCLMLFLLFSGDRALPRAKGFMVFLAAVLLASSPTWLWNLSHEFITFYHLGENANLEKQSYSFASLAGFFIAQFGVIGPISFFLLLVLPLYRHMRVGFLGGLHAFIWPVLIVICVQAFLSEANANWAAASMPAAVLLLAASLSCLSGKWPARCLFPALFINLFMTACLGVIVAAGSFGALTPKSDPLRRLRGWEELALKTDQLAQAADAKTLIAYSRASAALLHWHLGKSGYYIALPLGPNATGRGNHYQRSYPLKAASPRPWLALREGTIAPVERGDWQGPIDHIRIQISDRRTRDISYWLAP